jgi:hypothetical protein
MVSSPVNIALVIEAGAFRCLIKKIDGEPMHFALEQQFFFVPSFFSTFRLFRLEEYHRVCEIDDLSCLLNICVTSNKRLSRFMKNFN